MTEYAETLENFVHRLGAVIGVTRKPAEPKTHCAAEVTNERGLLYADSVRMAGRRLSIHGKRVWASDSVADCLFTHDSHAIKFLTDALNQFGVEVCDVDHDCSECSHERRLVCTNPACCNDSWANESKYADMYAEEEHKPKVKAMEYRILANMVEETGEDWGNSRAVRTIIRHVAEEMVEMEEQYYAFLESGCDDEDEWEGSDDSETKLVKKLAPELATAALNIYRSVNAGKFRLGSEQGQAVFDLGKQLHEGLAQS